MFVECWVLRAALLDPPKGCQKTAPLDEAIRTYAGFEDVEGKCGDPGVRFASRRQVSKVSMH
jgi:hypothetical protein